MACTQRIRSCSSSLAKITVSPSFTALKKVRPPSRPEGWTEEAVSHQRKEGQGETVMMNERGRVRRVKGMAAVV
ncbi:hypothetical protein EYF80_001421 [Liparis tanakae]|uniref:Uncharacterized protein n=1 Tax=Liparis tanakae TaxID=230148 RepID=A0A4Z2JD25_9TELE|nr:hypothetical protein EYF80_001421 [Liparis tanakae]